jgi:3,4-dihydroxy 2-butanone 4-phosphate synthase/GTP cyclohydrolase II
VQAGGGSDHKPLLSEKSGKGRRKETYDMSKQKKKKQRLKIISPGMRKTGRTHEKTPTAQLAAAALPDRANTPFSSVAEALRDLRVGRPIIMVDDAHRENEGDIVFAAAKMTPEKINFLLHHARGIICLALSGELCTRLGISLQTPENTTPTGTAFTVKIDARRGVTTGVSSADRARTILTAVSPRCRPEDLTRPGHVDCLRARNGGVLVRAGHTEGAVDLARMAGFVPAAVICEIMNPDGTMARLSQLELFAAEHKLKIISIQDLIEFRQRREKVVECVTQTELPSRWGKFTLYAYKSKLTDECHLALVKGAPAPGKKLSSPVLVRVHSECLTGDAFGSLRCDCGPQLAAAMRRISQEPSGIVLYMRQEGRGIGLLNKIRAYALQDAGADTVEANLALGFRADLRTYGTGAQILLDLGVRKMRLLTNNPRKIVGLQGFGLEVIERVSLVLPTEPENKRYLRSKRDKLAHWLDDVCDDSPRCKRSFPPEKRGGVKKISKCKDNVRKNVPDRIDGVNLNG